MAENPETMVPAQLRAIRADLADVQGSLGEIKGGPAPESRFSFRRNRDVSGIGGWLALLLFMLCMNLLSSFIVLAGDSSAYERSWAVPETRPAVAAMVAMALLPMAANLWAISALLQKKRSFRLAFVVFWLLSVAQPFSALALLLVPGISPQEAMENLDPRDVLHAVSVAIGLGFWALYNSQSVRVRNTMVN